jgi:hypothetical protein
MKIEKIFGGFRDKGHLPLTLEIPGVTLEMDYTVSKHQLFFAFKPPKT